MPLRVTLSAPQHALLAAVAGSALGRTVYWTGGTLLAAHYLHHRRSLDLDFFTEELPDDLVVSAAIRDISTVVGTKTVHHVRFPNRWQYAFQFRRRELKLELVYFPFPVLGRRPFLPAYGIRIDSLRDLTANKAHAAFERAEPRDTFDLYVILQRTGRTLGNVLQDVEQKFGVTIDPVHLVAKLRAGAERLLDLRPLAVGKLPAPADIQEFFQTHADQHLRRTLRRS